MAGEALIDQMRRAKNNGTLAPKYVPVLEELERRAKANAPKPKTFDEEATNALQLLNVGITETLGLPVDLVNMPLQLFGVGSDEPIGGSKSIQRGLSSLGAAPAPGEETRKAMKEAGPVLGNVMRLTGAATAGLPLAGLFTSLTGTGPTATAFREIGQTMVRRPLTTAAAELGSGVTAGVAGGIAEMKDASPGVKAMVELTGAFAPGLALHAVMTGADRITTMLPLVRTARQIILPSAVEGRRIGQERIREAIPGRPEDAVTRLDNAEMAELGFTPAQRIGSPRLLELETAVMNSTAELSAARQTQFENTNRAIMDTLHNVGDVGDATVQEAKDYLSALLDQRIQVARARMDDRIDRLAMATDPEQAQRRREAINIAASEELDSAYEAARAQNRELWGQVDLEEAIPAENARTAFKGFLDKTPKAQREDIPEIIGEVLGTDEGNLAGVELQGLRSKLLEIERQATAAGDRNRARIAGEMADAVLADMNAAENVSEAFDIARTFTSDMADRFYRGDVGKLLGFSREGGRTVDPSLILESVLGKTGPRARAATDALRRAVDNLDAPEMPQYMEAFLTDEFRRASFRNGRIDPNRAQTFLAAREAELTRFPELRRQMQDAADSGRDLITAERMIDPDSSAAAVFIGRKPGEEFEKSVNVARPRQAAEALLTVARLDGSGRAERGLKAAAIEYLEKRSQTTVRINDADVPILSGNKMQKVLDEPGVQQALEGMFTPEELGRIREMASYAQILELAGGTPGMTSIEGTITAELRRTIAGLLGAHFGRMLNTGTIQAPGRMAQFFERMTKAGVHNPARRLIVDAIQDETMLRAIIQREELPSLSEMQDRNRRLNAWVASVIAEQVPGDDDERAP